MKSALKPVQDMIMRSVDTVLPPRCILTGERVERQGMLDPGAWVQIEFIARPICRQCGFPFEFEVEQGALCAACIDRPPPFEKLRSVMKYNDASRKMILGFKHGDQTHAVKAFVPWLEKAGAELLEDADVLIPVPLHRWRLLARRYNQSAILAHSLSKTTKIPVAVHALKRVRSTPSQGYLKAAQRHKNVKRAFALNPKSDVKGKVIVLIDDVYTTGATVKECTKTLLKGGAKKVHVLTLARVVREGFGG
ncbi:MAG: ComF family protein [Alphaproteobacteria bacterium]